MFRRAAIVTAFGAALLSAQTLPAQQGGASFQFGGPALELRIASGGWSGSAELVDGAPGALAVTDRAGAGGTALRLAGAVLSIENQSGRAADYLISLPPGAKVSLAVDGRTVLSVAPAAGGRRLEWRWPGERAEQALRVPARRGGVRHRRGGFTVNAYAGPLVADSVDIVHFERVRALKIELGGTEFRVSGDRSVRFGFDEKIRWGVIAPGVEQVELRMALPGDIEFFRVRVDGTVVWEFLQGRGRSSCEPLAEVRRPDGTEVWVFTPEAGRLKCVVRRRPREVRRSAVDLELRAQGHEVAGRVRSRVTLGRHRGAGVHGPIVPASSSSLSSISNSTW